MNQYFVCIKVDREERPDVDQIYMNCALIVNGHGGWPLNALALPDGRPFFAGTYFPKQQWMQVLQYFANLFQKEPEKLITQAEHILGGLHQLDSIPLFHHERTLSDQQMQIVWDNWKDRLDLEWGGKLGAPKFMMPNNYLFLLNYFYHTKDETCGASIKQTMKRMAFGGLYDAIGGGFSRYSVDAHWKVPHFEKMLYDNAQLLSLYANAYSLTKRPLYKNVIEQTLEWLNREMTDTSGGIYSAQDADSEGVEGKYYAWTKNEIINELNNEGIDNGKLTDLALELYNISEEGNWEHGNNVLFSTKEHEYFTEKYNLTNEEFHTSVQQINAALFKVRQKRIRPTTDDKILTEWNALTITGLSDAYKALGDEKYLQKAIPIIDFILKNCLEEEQLYRNYKNGKHSISGLLADYAFFIEALVNLYTITLNNLYLKKALELLNYTLEHFYDPRSGMFYLKSDLDEKLIVRSMDSSDNVIPAANSAMANNLFTLGKITDHSEWEHMAATMLNNVLDDLLKNGAYYSNWANLLYKILHQDTEIIVIGENAKEMVRELHRHYLPNCLVLGSAQENELLHFKGRYVVGKTLIYVCKNKTCELPVESVDKIIGQLHR